MSHIKVRVCIQVFKQGLLLTWDLLSAMKGIQNCFVPGSHGSCVCCVSLLHSRLQLHLLMSPYSYIFSSHWTVIQREFNSDFLYEMDFKKTSQILTLIVCFLEAPLMDNRLLSMVYHEEEAPKSRYSWEFHTLMWFTLVSKVNFEQCFEFNCFVFLF